MKKLMAIATSLIVATNLQAGHGSCIGAGLFGIVAGVTIAAAATPPPPPTPVHVQPQQTVVTYMADGTQVVQYVQPAPVVYAPPSPPPPPPRVVVFPPPPPPRPHYGPVRTMPPPPPPRPMPPPPHHHHGGRPLPRR